MHGIDIDNAHRGLTAAAINEAQFKHAESSGGQPAPAVGEAE
jgi:hypothetical protein